MPPTGIVLSPFSRPDPSEIRVDLMDKQMATAGCLLDEPEACSGKNGGHVIGYGENRLN